MMNINHKIDMSREGAEEYAKLRHNVGFWNGLSEATRHGIVLYFTDSSLTLLRVAEKVNCDASSFRKVLIRRGLYSQVINRRRVKDPETGAIHYINARASGTSAAGIGVSGAIEALQAQKEQISAQMRELSVELDKLATAITTLKNL